MIDSVAVRSLLWPSFCTQDETSHMRLPKELKHGSLEAFEHLVADYKALLFQFFHRLQADSVAAENAAERVFLSAYRARKVLQATTDLTAWLFRIASDLARRLNQVALGSVLNSLPVQAAFVRLRTQEKVVILLHRFAGLTVDQLSMSLRLSRSGTAELLQQAYCSLQRELKGSAT